jgi:thiamine-monophosphate kinase
MALSQRKSSSGELSLIAAIRARAGVAREGVRIGIGDDCAVLRAGGAEDFVVTTDFSLEGRHFRRDWHPPMSAGWRCMVRGLSDLAAMGATPVGAFLSLAVPAGEAGSGFLRGFMQGVFLAAEAAGTQLAGGDTAESPSDRYLADIVLVGRVPRGRALLRSGARAGDAIYCTGALGGSAVELARLSESPRTYRRTTPAGEHPHLFPQARLKAGQMLLRNKLAASCMDLSDGLSSDLAQLCEASGVAAELEAERLPLHPLAERSRFSPNGFGCVEGNADSFGMTKPKRRGTTAAMGDGAEIKAALNGGEDYELLFTARPGVKMPRSVGGVKVTRIGTVLARKKGAPQVVLVQRDGSRQPLPRGGWEHLR